MPFFESSLFVVVFNFTDRENYSIVAVIVECALYRFHIICNNIVSRCISCMRLKVPRNFTKRVKCRVPIFLTGHINYAIKMGLTQKFKVKNPSIPSASNLLNRRPSSQGWNFCHPKSLTCLERRVVIVQLYQLFFGLR